MNCIILNKKKKTIYLKHLNVKPQIIFVGSIYNVIFISNIADGSTNLQQDQQNFFLCITMEQFFGVSTDIEI